MFDLQEVEKHYADAVEANLGLVLDKSGKDDTAAFFMSGHVGLHTGIVLELLQAPQVDWEVAETIIREEIMTFSQLCLEEAKHPEDEILYGSAGFIYAVNLLAHKLEPHAKAIPNNLVEDIHRLIERLVIKLAQQTMVEH